MIDKVAAPFWLCFSVGMMIGLAAGNEVSWLVGGAVVGLLVGFALAAHAMRRRREAFRGRAIVAAKQANAAATPTPTDVRRAA